MGIPSRHAGAPYQDGETLAGDDLETDIQNVYDVLNGDIDNSNIASDAAIDGSKLADTSITAGKLGSSAVTSVKIQDSAVTTAKINDDAVTSDKIADDTVTTVNLASNSIVRAYISTATATSVIATSVSYVAVADITPATVTASSTDDILIMDYTGSPAAIEGVNDDVQLGFDVDGTSVTCGSFTIPQSAAFQDTYHISFATNAPATTAIEIVPVSKGPTAETWNASVRTFRVLVIPAKA